MGKYSPPKTPATGLLSPKALRVVLKEEDATKITQLLGIGVAVNGMFFSGGFDAGL